MSISSFLKYAAIGATLSLLAGCTTPAPVTANVISPPSPRVGTGPIAAYDKYAFALFSSATSQAEDVRS